jgi:hypothetical protein
MADASNNIGISFDSLKKGINDATQAVKAKLDQIKSSGSAISIGDMFEMQMRMNQLAQLSEMSTSVISSMNSSVASMARNVKS